MGLNIVGNVLTVALGLYFLVQPALAQTKATVRIQEYPGSMQNMVNWVMVEKGFCEKAGIKCESVSLASAPLGQQALAAGSLDLVFSVIDVMMQGVSRGNDMQMVAVGIPDQIFTLLARSDFPQPRRVAGYPENMKDFKNAKIGVTSRGSSTEYMTKALFAGAGVSADELTFVAVGGPATAYAALAAKQVDLVLSWVPLPQICVGTKACNVVVDLTKGEGPPELKAFNGAYDIWYGRRAYIEKNEAAVDAFRVALEQATVWLKDPKNYAEALAIAKRNIKYGDNIPNADQVLETALKEQIIAYGTKVDRDVINKVVKAAGDFLLKIKVIDKPLDADTIVYRKLLLK